MTPSFISLLLPFKALTKIEEVMTGIKNWMVKKKLKLNDDKTVCMLFGTETSKASRL